jgi:hypothetical protein
VSLIGPQRPGQDIDTKRISVHTLGELLAHLTRRILPEPMAIACLLTALAAPVFIVPMLLF